MQRVTDTIIGVGGIGLVETIPNVLPQSHMDYPALTQTVIQILIGLATLLGLFRKNRV